MTLCFHPDCHLHVDERRRAAIESPPFFILPPLARRCLLPRERKTSVTSAHVSWAELPFDVGDAKGLVGAEMKTDPKENETRIERGATPRVFSSIRGNYPANGRAERLDAEKKKEARRSCNPSNLFAGRTHTSSKLVSRHSVFGPSVDRLMRPCVTRVDANAGLFAASVPFSREGTNEAFSGTPTWRLGTWIWRGTRLV